MSGRAGRQKASDQGDHATPRQRTAVIVLGEIVAIGMLLVIWSIVRGRGCRSGPE